MEIKQQEYEFKKVTNKYTKSGNPVCGPNLELAVFMLVKGTGL